VEAEAYNSILTVTWYSWNTVHKGTWFARRIWNWQLRKRYIMSLCKTVTYMSEKF